MKLRSPCLPLLSPSALQRRIMGEASDLPRRSQPDHPCLRSCFSSSRSSVSAASRTLPPRAYYLRSGHEKTRSKCDDGTPRRVDTGVSLIVLIGCWSPSYSGKAHRRRAVWICQDVACGSSGPRYSTRSNTACVVLTNHAPSSFHEYLTPRSSTPLHG